MMQPIYLSQIVINKLLSITLFPHTFIVSSKELWCSVHYPPQREAHPAPWARGLGVGRAVGPSPAGGNFLPSQRPSLVGLRRPSQWASMLGWSENGKRPGTVLFNYCNFLLIQKTCVIIWVQIRCWNYLHYLFVKVPNILFNYNIKPFCI